MVLVLEVLKPQEGRKGMGFRGFFRSRRLGVGRRSVGVRRLGSLDESHSRVEIGVPVDLARSVGVHQPMKVYAW